MNNPVILGCFRKPALTQRFLQGFEILPVRDVQAEVDVARSSLNGYSMDMMQNDIACRCANDQIGYFELGCYIGNCDVNVQRQRINRFLYAQQYVSPRVLWPLPDFWRHRLR